MTAEADDNAPTRKIPTPKEIFEAAQEAKYDSLGICVDPEMQAALEELNLAQRIEFLVKYREDLWKSLGLK